ncbi:hypothetical protein ACQE3E_17555 [Methylomonas sp. MED-D]|uniref:hypothetical protein n=1 Tax=unclassified Methylomonas TaxID=2608980 RepID=UPI0028A316B9|nr:hypothetical protein [Methylomonas sp. MV1]MDT4330838.1 hypothetical protein [Methylomonas sp. MV1]
MKKLAFSLLLVAVNAQSAVTSKLTEIETVMPGELCNAQSNDALQKLMEKHMDDRGIINLYALYLGLCQLVHQGTITEQVASEQWVPEKTRLIESRRRR